MAFSRIGRIGLAAAVMACAGCARGAGDGTDPAKVATGAAIKPLAEYFPLKVGNKELRAQIAVLDSEQQVGLMGRKDLGADDGMVFVYPAPQQMNFWMRNTPSPLDIGFFKEDGTLGEVYPMYPYDETTLSSKGDDYTLALEMPQGWFAKKGLKPGAVIDHAALAAALRARGFEPRRYAVRTE